MVGISVSTCKIRNADDTMRVAIDCKETFFSFIFLNDVHRVQGPRPERVKFVGVTEVFVL